MDTRMIFMLCRSQVCKVVNIDVTYIMQYLSVTDIGLVHQWQIQGRDETNI